MLSNRLAKQGGRRIREDVLERDYCLAWFLAALEESDLRTRLALKGGTALKRCYFVDYRFSEDLDFSLERPDRGYDFRAFLRSVQADLHQEGYEVGIKANDRKVVHSAFVNFPGLLFELSLSPHRNESLSIRIEVDTRPPQGAILEVTLVRRHLTLRLQHHDRASLLAGKLHALLQRPYPKGRDLYDLIWYLSDPTWPSPNLVLLNNALRQTGWKGPEVTEASWRRLVRQRIETFDWDRIVTDVQPFLESAAELPLVSRENALRVLEV